MTNNEAAGKKRGAQTHEGLTAFGSAEEAFRRRHRQAPINAQEFERKLARCSLATCRGTCCYDGVPVDEGTSAVLQGLARDRSSEFADMGLDLPHAVIVENEWRGALSKKTATKRFPFRALVSDFPEHFNETACVFLLDDGRCGLQVLALKDDRHPWFYKPFTCWLHPIKMSDSGIHLYNEYSDPNRFPEYAGYVCSTHCGRTRTHGVRAAELLHDELTFLGQLLGRDIVSELQSARMSGPPIE